MESAAIWVFFLLASGQVKLVLALVSDFYADILYL